MSRQDPRCRHHHPRELEDLRRTKWRAQPVHRRQGGRGVTWCFLLNSGVNQTETLERTGSIAVGARNRRRKLGDCRKNLRMICGGPAGSTRRLARRLRSAPSPWTLGPQPSPGVIRRPVCFQSRSLSWGKSSSALSRRIWRPMRRACSSCRSPFMTFSARTSAMHWRLSSVAP